MGASVNKDPLWGPDKKCCSTVRVRRVWGSGIGLGLRAN